MSMACLSTDRDLRVRPTPGTVCMWMWSVVTVAEITCWYSNELCVSRNVTSVLTFSLYKTRNYACHVTWFEPAVVLVVGVYRGGNQSRQGQQSFILYKASRPFVGSLILLLMGAGRSTPGVKQPGCVSWLLTSIGCEVENNWSYAFTPPSFIRGWGKAIWK
jgi:hypothetical protein